MSREGNGENEVAAGCTESKIFSDLTTISTGCINQQFERIRKKTRLENDAQKYKKLTNMFATSSSTSSIVNISMADVATIEIITDLHRVCDAVLSPNEAYDSKNETADSFDDNAVKATSYPSSDIQYKLNSSQCEL